MTIGKLSSLAFIFCLGLGAVHAQNDTSRLKVDSLKAAVVTAKARPRLKTDTIEYNTTGMLVQPNAVVEDMLRRLPGLRVDADGKITYNGEKIQHLLVDGEDIFGSDPTIVTRNLDASKIASVQVLDRKSDHALFSGVDDGIRTKTLNLVLKEGAKGSFFGKVEAGGDTGGYFNTSGSLASFQDKEQFMLLGLAANTGVLGFTSTLGGSPSDVSYINGNADVLGASAGKGIPRFEVGGMHFANIWNESVDHVTGNYQYSHYYTQPVTSAVSLQTQADSLYSQYQQSRSFNWQDQHYISGMYDWKPSARTAVQIAFQGITTRQRNEFSAIGEDYFNDTIVNSSQRSIRDNVNRTNITTTMAWLTQLGGKPGRTLSIRWGFNKDDVTTNGFIYSLNRFYLPNGTAQSNDTVDQRKEIVARSLNLGAGLNYTESLWKGAGFAASYSINTIGNDPLQATFDQDDGKYQSPVDSLSSQFHTRTISQDITLNLQGTQGPFRYTAGSSVIDYRYRQNQPGNDSLMKVGNTNWTPRLLVAYSIDKTIKLNLNYTVSTQQPVAEQLTPSINNSDPLHIMLGNPGLKPQIDRNLQFAIHRSGNWLVNLLFSGTLSSNSITTKTVTDSLGRQVSQPLNADGDKSANINFSLSRRLWAVDVAFHITGLYARTLNYVDTYLSRNDAYTTGSGFSLNKYVANKYDLQFYSDFFYFYQLTSINTATPIHYWSQSHSGSLTIFLFRDLELNTNATYTWQQKTSVFAAGTSVLLWNSYISRNLLQSKLVVRVQLNNILNQNAGITRINVNNINTQSSTNILGRYWMLSATYHFDKKLKKK